MNKECSNTKYAKHAKRMEVDVKQTLDRISYTGSRQTTLSVLAALQQAFLLTVPFENLDIHQARPILLEPGAAEHKIVEEKRGGFCYESNGLFHRLLETLNFRVRMCSAQMMGKHSLSPVYDHMVLTAEIDEHEYLVDVGNGESVRTPMQLDSGLVSTTPEGKMYRIGKFEGMPTLEVRTSDKPTWQTRFVVNPIACRLEDFRDRCQFHQTSEESLFTGQPLVTLALREGRATLTGRTLKVLQRNRLITQQEIHSDEEYHACLQTQFGIYLHKKIEKVFDDQRNHPQ